PRPSTTTLFPYTTLFRSPCEHRRDSGPPVVRWRGVITIAIVGGVALVIVLVTRGSFSQLFRLPIQSIWMVLVALAIQILLAFVEDRKSTRLNSSHRTISY